MTITVQWRTQVTEEHQVTIDLDEYPDAISILEGDNEEYDPSFWLSRFETDSLTEIAVTDRDNFNWGTPVTGQEPA